MHFLERKCINLLTISLKFVPINNNPVLVRLVSARPLSESMMVKLLTHICVTRPQWVNKFFMKEIALYHISSSGILHSIMLMWKFIHHPYYSIIIHYLHIDVFIYIMHMSCPLHCQVHWLCLTNNIMWLKSYNDTTQACAQPMRDVITK